MSKIYISDTRLEQEIDEIVVDNKGNSSGNISIKPYTSSEFRLAQGGDNIYVDYCVVDNLIKGLQKAKELWEGK